MLLQFTTITRMRLHLFPSENNNKKQSFYRSISYVKSIKPVRLNNSGCVSGK